MKSVVRLAVIGVGMISSFHMNAIDAIEGVELAGVYDAPSMDRAREIAKSRGVTAYATLDALWQDKQVDGVCICTPSGTHGSLALEAIRNGKHVLIEKPMALTPEECEAIRVEAARGNLQVGVVSQLRFSPGIQLVRQAVQDGKLGKILYTELNMKYYRNADYYSGSTWRGTKTMDGGGALMNQGIHGVDLLQYIAGMPQAVFAQSRTLLHKVEVEDTLNAILLYENGALGNIVATTSVYPGFSRKLTICGENGTVGLEEDTICCWEMKDGSKAPDFEATTVRGSSDPNNISCEGHIRQIDNFAQAIRGAETLLVDAEEGCKPLRMIWSVYRSAEENTLIQL